MAPTKIYSDPLDSLLWGLLRGVLAPALQICARRARTKDELLAPHLLFRRMAVRLSISFLFISFELSS
jgi:hypothetical protein